MASQKVTIEMTVAEAAAVNNILAVAKAFKHVDRAMAAMGVSGGAAGGKMSAGFDVVGSAISRATKAFLSLNMGLRAFSEIVSAVRTQLQATERFRTEAYETSVTVGRAMTRVMKLAPTGPAMDMTPQQIEDYIMANRGTVPVETIAAALETAVSGGMGMPFSERLSTAVDVSKVLEGFPAEMVEAAGRSIQMLREAYNVPAKEAAAMYIAAERATTVESPELTAKNIVDTATKLKELGFSLKDALAAAATAQTLTKDVEGAATRTALINNLVKAYSATGGKYQGRELIDFMKAGGKFAGDPEALRYNKKLLGALQRESETTKKETERLRARGGEVDDKLLSRATTLLGMVKMFQLAPEAGGPKPEEPGGEFVKNWAIVVEELTDVIPKLDAMVKRVETMPMTREYVAEKEREARKQTEQLAARPDLIRARIVKELRDNILARSGIAEMPMAGYLEEKYVRAPMGDVIREQQRVIAFYQELEKTLKNVYVMQQQTGTFNALPGAGFTYIPGTRTQKQQTSYEQLQQTILAEQAKLAELMRQNTEATQANTEAMAGAPPPLPPTAPVEPGG